MSSLADVVARMVDGDRLTVEGWAGFVDYAEDGATGDDGQPVRGDTVGDYTIRAEDGRTLATVHKSPGPAVDGTGSRYGNPHARRYAAEQVARYVLARAR